jgi:hypothetical protein
MNQNEDDYQINSSKNNEARDNFLNMLRDLNKRNSLPGI